MLNRIDDAERVVATATYRDRAGRERYNRRKFQNRQLRLLWILEDDARREVIRARLALENELEIASTPLCELEDRTV